jgi:histidinol-phosphate aminotransferase
MVLIKSRTRVAIPAPTFTVYRLIANVLGAKIVDVPLNADMSYDVDALISKSQESGAGVLIINTPNNPTGAVLRGEGLQRILEQFSGHVLLDEAYYEFWGQTGLKFLKEYPRLIITRTFSKAMGMAGLRVGYLLAHPDIGRFRPAIEAVMKERERLGRELGQMPGIKVYPSEANFFLIEVPVEPRAIFEDLYEQGILIRDVSSYPMLSKCLRVSVGAPDENNRLLSALRAALNARAMKA